MNALDTLIALSLEEDIGAAGDVTSEALIPASAKGEGELWAKEPMVFSGGEAFARVFAYVDPRAQVKLEAKEGQWISSRRRVAQVKGNLRALLLAERTALNILQRTCGIATATRQAVAAVKGTRLRILDTRKTAPGFRALSKAAVRAGGGENHRFGLFDGILIKDNHLAAVGGSVRTAIERARAHATHLLRVEIEVTSLRQLDEAISAGADVVMLDNFEDAGLRAAVKRAKGRVKLEVSGGVTLERLPRLARLGVDFVSMGALTHAARAMDLSLELWARGA
ncbi:MAG: carboxylating nicotinate-nucleotide diphosphorylase [Myxococcaceae bacterium]